MSRLTRFITPVGMCITNLNSMKHYRPCVPCRDKAGIKTDGNGKQYTEKFSFCDTCEVKMLFNKLKHYEDLEEQGRLIEVVTCKECKYYKKDTSNKNNPCGYCEIIPAVRYANEYCSLAERKLAELKGE